MRPLLPGLLLLLLVAALASAPPDARVVVDENPPREDVVPLVPRWAIDTGEGSDFVIGRSVAAAPGADGGVLLLDGQIGQVLVVSSEGEIVRVFGQYGEGPGDLPGAYRGFQLTDGRIGVCGGAPMFTFVMGVRAEIVLFDAEDRPAGIWRFAESPQRTAACAVREARCANDRVLAATQVTEALEQGLVLIEDLVLLSPPDGARTVVDRRRSTFDPTDPQTEESEGFEPFAGGRCDLSVAGRVAWAPARDEWRVHIREPDGETRVWFRNSTAVRRTEEKKAEIQRRLGPPELMRIADTEPVIGRIRWRPDGRLWVEPDGVEPKDGAIACFDELSPDGKLLRRVHLMVPEPEPGDRLLLLEDGRFVLLRGYGPDSGENRPGGEANPRILLLESR